MCKMNDIHCILHSSITFFWKTATRSSSDSGTGSVANILQKGNTVIMVQPWYYCDERQ